MYDYQGGDGMITEENISEIRKRNFSGRTFKKNFDITELILEIEKYQKSMGAINRQIILRGSNKTLLSCVWIPAFAGMTAICNRHSGFC